MKQKKLQMFIWLVITLIVGSACGFSTVATPLPDQAAIESVAAATWEVMQTELALSATATLTPPPPSLTPTFTVPPTITPSLTPTRTPVPMLTSVPLPTSTLTPIPTRTNQNTAIPSLTNANTAIPTNTRTSGGATVVPTKPSAPCLQAKLVKNITIPEGSRLPSQTVFKKVWRIQNTGSCTWAEGKSYMVHQSGNSMGGVNTQLSEKVPPGATVDVELNLTAPTLPGYYEGGWVLRIDGDKLGHGSNGKGTFDVAIEVTNTAGGVIFDFSREYCTALWKNGKNSVLPCPGKLASDLGFVFRADGIKLEDGLTYDDVLLTQPQKTTNGLIQGAYPSILIQAGDRFRGNTGCVFGYEKCNTYIEVYYKVNEGAKARLGDWTELYEGTLFNFDVDLSTFAGNWLSFTFVINAAGSANEDTIGWILPQLYRP